MSRIAVARARADIKDMYVDSGGREMVPFLEVLDGMVKRGVEVRLIHAKEPGPNWWNDFDCYPIVRDFAEYDCHCLDFSIFC